jgi:hypothetical protein
MSAGHVRTTAEDLASQIEDALIPGVFVSPGTMRHSQSVEATLRSPNSFASGLLHPASCEPRHGDIRSWRPEGRRYVGPDVVWPAGSRA